MTDSAPVVVDLPHSDHVRTASDLLRLVVALLAALPAVLLAALGSDTMIGVQADILRAIGRVPGPVRSTTIGLAQLLALAAPMVVVVVLAVQHRFRLVAMLVVGAALAALTTVALEHTVVADAQPGAWARLANRESWIAERAFPTSAYLSGAAAVVVVLGAWTGRRWRHALWMVLAAGVLARIASGANLPVDLAVALCAGVAVGSVVLLAAGAPDLAPTGAQVAGVLSALGLRPLRVDEQPVGSGGSRHYLADVATGPQLLVMVHDDNDRDRDLLYRLWRFVRLRSPVDEQIVVSVRAEAEREALVSLWLRQAGADVPQPVAVGRVNQSAALVARRHVAGQSLMELTEPKKPELAPEAVTDGIVDGVWRVVAQLRASRVAHRSFDLDCFVIDDAHAAWLVRVAGADLGSTDELLDLDVAHLLVALASRVGAERAVASACRVLGEDAVRSSLPYVQVLGLPLPLRLRLRRQEGVVAEVREAVVTATRAEPTELARLQRVRPATLLAIAAPLLALVVLLPQLTSLEEAVEALGDADVAWLVPAVLALPVLYVGPTVAMLGALARRLPFGQVYLAQVAAAFLNRVTPNGVGGLGVNLRFLQRAGVDAATAGGAVAVTSLGGGLANVVLMTVFVVWAGQSHQPVFELPDRSVLLAGFAVVLAAVGIVAFVPVTRRLIGTRLGDLVRRTTAELRGIAASPVRLALVLGGSLAGPLTQILVLGLSLEALGAHVGIAPLGAVYIGGKTLGSAAPTPGGLGGVEAALIAGLTGVDVDPAVATSSVLVYRFVTYWLVIPCGWLALRRLRRHDEI